MKNIFPNFVTLTLALSLTAHAYANPLALKWTGTNLGTQTELAEVQASVEIAEPHKQLMSNQLLAEIYRDDQSARSGKRRLNADVRTEEEGRHLVLELLAFDKVRTPEDKFFAARILHHTDIVNCGWPKSFGKTRGKCSKSPENYLLAHNLARSAYNLGYEAALPLIPRSMDRYLYYTKGHQKYGTFVIRDAATGKFVLPYIDRRTEDSERLSLGVKPLQKILEKYQELPETNTGKP
ncbi:MAG: hypothetical protein COB37_00885 [Kordiimonadales bacterium]|nr:MAG: hypothetical protein COB37_00885 [Kordiimonadales bacterium]